jgi:hypothetical protein
LLGKRTSNRSTIHPSLQTNSQRYSRCRRCCADPVSFSAGDLIIPSVINRPFVDYLVHMMAIFALAYYPGPFSSIHLTGSLVGGGRTMRAYAEHVQRTNATIDNMLTYVKPSSVASSHIRCYPHKSQEVAYPLHRTTYTLRSFHKVGK